jgi:hypothetical protein
MTLRMAEAEQAAAVPVEATRIAPIAVRTDSAMVLEFQRASGGEPMPGLVPLIFPIRWLGLPEVRARLLAVAGGDIVPVHESQSFTTVRRLELDRDYLLAMEMIRTSRPERLTLHGTVSTPDGEVGVWFETVLRLVGLAGGAAGVSK